mgnify:CR=1 FL=1
MKQTQQIKTKNAEICDLLNQKSALEAKYKAELFRLDCHIDLEIAIKNRILAREAAN